MSANQAPQPGSSRPNSAVAAAYQLAYDEAMEQLRGMVPDEELQWWASEHASTETAGMYAYELPEYDEWLLSQDPTSWEA